MTGRGKLMLSLALKEAVDPEKPDKTPEYKDENKPVCQQQVSCLTNYYNTFSLTDIVSNVQGKATDSELHGKSHPEDEKDNQPVCQQVSHFTEYYNNMSSPNIVSVVDDSDADPDYVPESDEPQKTYFTPDQLTVRQINATLNGQEDIDNDTTGSILIDDPLPLDESIIGDVPEELSDPVNANGENEKENIRKRIRNPENWGKNVKKLRINSGKSYVSRMGKVHQAKEVKPACENCSFECTSQISMECRRELLKNVYDLGDKTRQRDFISKCITVISPKQDKGRKCSTNKAYHFVVNGKNIRVCKKFFTSTLDISNNAVATVISKTNESGYVEEEKRGKHDNHVNKTDGTKIQDVVAHINSFPRIESHYCRSRTKKQYLEGSLNLTLMHRLYKDKCIEEGKEWVRKPMYERVFNTQFNIGFHKPKKDLCSVCEAFKNNPGDPDSKLKHEAHLNDVKVAREEKDQDKRLCQENNNIMTCCYDLQAAITLPQGNVSDFFYKLKLNNLNFTIFDLGQKLGYCYLWHEEMAKRGANEITTCVYLFLKEVVNQSNKHDVIFYSDKCVSQNKNKFLFSMYLYCVENLNIESITHKYLVVGHTENEGDSMHACIEKEKTRVLKSGPLFVPSQLSTVIKCSKRSGNPYRVTEMRSANFINWKAVSEKMGKNFNANTENEKVKWNEIKVVKVQKSDKNTIFYKNAFNRNEDLKKIDIS